MYFTYVLNPTSLYPGMRLTRCGNVEYKIGDIVILGEEKCQVTAKSGKVIEMLIIGYVFPND